jgi:hypothetical protein
LAICKKKRKERERVYEDLQEFIINLHSAEHEISPYFSKRTLFRNMKVDFFSKAQVSGCGSSVEVQISIRSSYSKKNEMKKVDELRAHYHHGPKKSKNKKRNLFSC